MALVEERTNTAQVASTEVEISSAVATLEPRAEAWRLPLVAALLAAPLGFLWLEYANLSMGLPFYPPARDTAERGRILMREGDRTITLAESVTVGKETERRHPQGRLAASVIGFVGDEQKGLYGMEIFHDDALKRGKDLILTLDPIIQTSSEATLENAIASTGAESGTVVVLEAKTNRLLAVANAPGFDASDWRSGSDASWKNRAFMDTFDPGSTIKTLIASALVNEGKAEPDSPMYAPMFRRFRNAPPIRDNLQHRPDLDLNDVLRYSSNVGISQFAERLGPQKVHDYLSAFGFGRRVWTDDPSAGTGRLTDWQGWRPRDFATHTFGQGFTSTALQLAAAFSVVANDGKYITPTLFEGQKVPAPYNVISSDTAKTTLQMMEYTVKEGVKRAQVPGYCVGGKTGTSETWQGGKKSSNRFHALFAGVFPADAPKYIIAVQLYAPKTQYHGSMVSAPIFKQMVLEIAAHKGIAPQPCNFK
jgi:cell division protein FtsI (penicillin-binding protein 3)